MATIELSTLVNRTRKAEDDETPIVVAKKEEKSENSYTFTIQNEDHTLGNMLTDQLLSEQNVLFAGYRIEHPTKDLIKIRVQVKDQIEKPIELVQPAIDELKTKISSLSQAFRESLKQYEEKNPSN